MTRTLSNFADLVAASRGNEARSDTYAEAFLKYEEMATISIVDAPEAIEKSPFPSGSAPRLS